MEIRINRTRLALYAGALVAIAAVVLAAAFIANVGTAQAENGDSWKECYEDGVCCTYKDKGDSLKVTCSGGEIEKKCAWVYEVKCDGNGENGSAADCTFTERYVCKNGSSDDESGPSPYVFPLSDHPAMNQPGPNGAVPCGMFDVGGWGHRVADLKQFPACTPPDLTVYCLDEDGNWTQGDLSGIVASVENNTVAFQSGQHGVCGIFPTN
jgi:hypothetical protein